jgi:hypothetical protein
MNYLIPKTLSYYFTKIGYPKFIDWYTSSVVLEPIYNDIAELTTIIDKSHWLEDELRSELFKNIKNTIVKQIETSLGKEPEKIYEDWITSIQPYCFQGGLGHKIQYSSNTSNTSNTSNSIPHHWCIKPEYYKLVINIPENVILSGIVCDKYINISEKSEIQYWCN